MAVGVDDRLFLFRSDYDISASRTYGCYVGLPSG